MSKLRLKSMNIKEFEAVAARNWQPVNIILTLPEWMSGIPEERLAYVFASGSFVDPRLIEVDDTVYSGVVGGMDVFRHDPKDVAKGYPFNKDHYLVINNPKADESLLVVGPLKDDDHWLDKLPEIEPSLEAFEFKGTLTGTQSDDS